MSIYKCHTHKSPNTIVWSFQHLQCSHPQPLNLGGSYLPSEHLVHFTKLNESKMSLSISLQAPAQTKQREALSTILVSIEVKGFVNTT